MQTCRQLATNSVRVFVICITTKEKNMKKSIITTGIRATLLLLAMPTASSAQINRDT